MDTKESTKDGLWGKVTGPEGSRWATIYDGDRSIGGVMAEYGEDYLALVRAKRAGPSSEIAPPASPAATPRTDAAEYDQSKFSDWGTGPSGYVDADFARTLERECADLRGQLDRMRISTVQQELEMEGLRGQLAEAQAHIEMLDANKYRIDEAVAKVYNATCLLLKEEKRNVKALSAALATAKASERERCAKVADDYNYGPCGQYDYSYTDEKAKADERAEEIADAIRALKEEA